MTRNVEFQSGKVEIHVPEADTKDLRLLDRSDIVFAVLYAALFVWGLVLTIISI